MRVSTHLSVALLALLCFILPNSARAEIADVLGDIQWGDSHMEVIEKIREARLAELREDPRNRNDRVAMQRARQRVLDQMRAAEDSFIELRGRRTGYEVSVVAEEFVPNNGESLIRVRDTVAQRFFIFLDGKLYKMVAAYDQEYIANIGFEAFLNHATQRYGRPSTTNYGSVLGEDVLVQAVWEDARSQLRIDDRRELFGTFTMTFTDLRTLRRLQQEGRVASGRNDGEEEVSDRVRALMQIQARDPNAGVVDALVGDVNVELPPGPKAQDSEEEEESSSSSASAEASKGEKKAEETKRAPQRRRSRPATTPKPADDDDLFIY